MTTGTALQYNTIWIREPGYAVSAFKPGIAGLLSELKRALAAGIAAVPDAKRTNFYDIELAGRLAYIYVLNVSRTVYLVALSSTA